MVMLVASIGSGSPVSPAAGTNCNRLAAAEEEPAAVKELTAVGELAAVGEQSAVLVQSKEVEASGAVRTTRTAQVAGWPRA